MLIHNNSTIFISGAAKRMPADVRKTIISVLGQYGSSDSDNMTVENAEKFIINLERNKKYILDCWSS